MANTILPVQCQYATLSGSGCAIGATTIVLSSFVDINGTNLSMSSFGQRGYGTLEPNNSTQEEQISFTGITQNANGTATLTGIKTVLFISPFTETSGVTKAHPGGSKFIISNTSGLYNNFANKLNTESIVGIWTFNAVTGIPKLSVDHKYGVNDELKLITYAALQSATYAGVVDMSLTAKGIGEEATQAEIEAGTQTGSTAAQLIVNPKYLKDSIYYTQLPAAGEKLALVGSFGAPGSSNTYVTTADVSSVAVAGAIVRAKGDSSLPALSGINLVSTSIAGLYVANQVRGDIIYKKLGAGWGRLPIGVATQVLVGGASAPAYADGILWQYISSANGSDSSAITTPTGAQAAVLTMSVLTTGRSTIIGDITIFKIGKTVGTLQGDNSNTSSVTGTATWEATQITITKGGAASSVTATAYYYK